MNYYSDLSKHLNETLEIHQSLFNEPLTIDDETVEFLKLHDQYDALHMECSLKMDGDRVLSKDRYNIYFKQFRESLFDSFFSVVQLQGIKIPEGVNDCLKDLRSDNLEKIAFGTDRNDKTKRYKFWARFKDAKDVCHRWEGFDKASFPSVHESFPLYKDMILSMSFSENQKECARIYVDVTKKSFDSYSIILNSKMDFMSIVKASRSVILCFTEAGDVSLNVAPFDFREFVKKFEPDNLFRKKVQLLDSRIDSGAAYITYSMANDSEYQRTFYF